MYVKKYRAKLFVLFQNKENVKRYALPFISSNIKEYVVGRHDEIPSVRSFWEARSGARFISREI